MPKEKRRARKVRSVNKSPWKTWERIWAESGVIRIQSKDGKIVSLSIRDAASRAQQLNNMMSSRNVPDDIRKDTGMKIEKIIEVIKEAKSQMESPGDLATAGLKNVLSGRTVDGKPLPHMNPDQKLQNIQFQYPQLSLDEVRTICSEGISLEEKHGIMRCINSDRIMAPMVAKK